MLVTRGQEACRLLCPARNSRRKLYLVQVMCKASSDQLTPGHESTSDFYLSRRNLLIQPLALSALSSLPTPVASADEAFKELSDPILAYSFSYPVATSSGKPLRMILARVPEKYSSAAPLTADARQRIVSELIDVVNFVSVSVSVGPISGPLKDGVPSSWDPRDVAETVLIDRSTSRTSTGQRIALNDVQDAYKTEHDGLEYYIYEHISQGSPTLKEKTRETYRHGLAVTSWRPAMDGTPYLYTLNVACPQGLWDDMEGLIKASVESFRLLTPTRSYIPPDQNPWLFF